MVTQLLCCSNYLGKPQLSLQCLKYLNHDYRPVALSSIAMKCFEHIISDILVEETKPFIDPFQFAYCAKGGVEDAVVSMIHKISEHLDKPRSYVRTLFIDFSSAFNTTQPHTLICKLQNMNTNPYVSWISDFLSNRLTLLWFDLSKSFKICLLAKWLSIFLNLLKHSIIFCYCTTTPFNTLWKDLKGRQIGLWYTPMIKVCLFRELFHLSKPFIGPFCQTVF